MRQGGGGKRDGAGRPPADRSYGGLLRRVSEESLKDIFTEYRVLKKRRHLSEDNRKEFLQMAKWLYAETKDEVAPSLTAQQIHQKVTNDMPASMLSDDDLAAIIMSSPNYQRCKEDKEQKIRRDIVTAIAIENKAKQ